MILNIIKYASVVLFVASFAIHASTFYPTFSPSMADAWFMQIGVLTVFGAMIYSAIKLKGEKKREKGQKYPDWYREQLQSTFSDKNKLCINAIPGIVFFLCIVAFLYAFVNFITCMIAMEGGGPSFESGRYYLTSHGKIIRELSKQEYYQFSAYELRAFSGHWIIFSLLPSVFFVWVYPATKSKQLKELEQRDS